MGIKIRERIGAAPIIDIEAGTDNDVANRTVGIEHIETIRMVLHARQRLKVVGNQRNIRRVAEEERGAIRRPAKKITTLTGLAGDTEILVTVRRIVIGVDLCAGAIKNLRVAPANTPYRSAQHNGRKRCRPKEHCRCRPP